MNVGRECDAVERFRLRCLITIRESWHRATSADIISPENRSAKSNVPSRVVKGWQAKLSNLLESLTGFIIGFGVLVWSS